MTSNYETVISAKDIFISKIHEPFQNELKLTLTIGHVSKTKEEVFIEATRLGNLSKIETDGNSPKFTVFFNSYICYNVVNESYDLPNTDEFIGNKIRIYSNSNLLKYVQLDTFASDPWVICALN